MRKSAIANLKKAVAMDPEFTEAMVELAYQYELAKDYVSAEQIYGSILEQSDSFPEARLRLINLNLKLNDPAKALELALSGPPTKSFILDAVLMFINDGFFAQGSTVLDMLTTGTAVPAEYYFYKAVIADEGENDPAKALTYLDEVKDTDRLYPHALRFKAQLLAVQGKVDEALAMAAQGKKLYPNASIFYILEAGLKKNQDDMAGAEAALKEGLTRLRNDPELTYELAMVYEVTDRRALGLALMETIIRSHPDHANALNYVGYTLAEEGRELDRALVLVTKASKLDPENGYILDSVAWVHFKRNDLEKAWEYIRYAVDVVDKDPTIWEHYGDIAAALGKTKSARKGYNYALKYHSPEAEAVKEKLKKL
jgi:tetratricopeptide (TPR) repeat protein